LSNEDKVQEYLDLMRHLSEVVQFNNTYLFPDELKDGVRVSSKYQVDGVDDLAKDFVEEEEEFIAWLSQ